MTGMPSSSGWNGRQNAHGRALCQATAGSRSVARQMARYRRQFLVESVSMQSDCRFCRACRRSAPALATADFITVDTEFMREQDLLAAAVPGPGRPAPTRHAAIDPLAAGHRPRAPAASCSNDEQVLKVFHAARQDIEIFFHMTGRIPHPLFDTQVAAMVCGFGDRSSYETLVSKLAGARIDKSSRFTDWSAPAADRPAGRLRAGRRDPSAHIYEGLAKRLMTTAAARWLEEEMAMLLDPATYRIDPDEAWRRLKPRSAASRACSRSCARSRRGASARRSAATFRATASCRDEAIMEIAAHAPSTARGTLARCAACRRASPRAASAQDAWPRSRTALARCRRASCPSCRAAGDCPAASARSSTCSKCCSR